MAEEREAEPNLQHRTAPEVARRCLGLAAVVTYSLGRPRDETLQWLDRFALTEYLSRAERAYLADPNPTRQSVVDFSWRAEGLAALLWALAGMDELGPSNVQIDLAPNKMLHAATQDPHQFVASAALRPAQSILEAEARLFQEHWRVRDAELFGRPVPPGLDAGIVYERRYALSWLVGWGTDWDEVPTDT